MQSWRSSETVRSSAWKLWLRLHDREKTASNEYGGLGDDINNETSEQVAVLGFLSNISKKAVICQRGAERGGLCIVKSCLDRDQFANRNHHKCDLLMVPSAGIFRRCIKSFTHLKTVIDLRKSALQTLLWARKSRVGGAGKVRSEKKYQKLAPSQN